MKKSIVVAAAIALVYTGTALAGGWATVKLSSKPMGLAADEPWIVDVTVLQHGLASQPLSGLKPTITIRSVSSARPTSSSASRSVVRTFRARPTGRAGVYRVKVVFPRAGMWRYEVYDAFIEYGGARTHTFKPVKIAPSGT